MVTQNPQNFHIEEPLGDTGFLVIVIKYGLLFCFIFVCVKIVLLQLGLPKMLPEAFVNEYPNMLNVIICLGIMVYLYFTIKLKYTYGEVFHLEFSAEALIIREKNMFDGSIIEKSIPLSHLNVKLISRKHKHGSSLLIHLMNYQKLLSKIPVTQSAWSRHEQLEEMLGMLKSYSIH